MLQQISKAEAKKLFDKGVKVLFAPSKCNAYSEYFTAWIDNNGEWETRASYNGKVISAFQNAVNHFWYYNCNAETGKRVHFYINK